MRHFWSRLPSRLDRAREAVRSADRRLLVEMIVFASAVPLLMRLRLTRIHRILEWRRREATISAETLEHIVGHFHLARRIAAPLVGSGCVTRGVTLYYFLTRAGADVSLCFGMGNIDGEYTGHCWLTRMGAPFLESRDPRLLYTRIFSIPDDVAP
jgi:Transglutaminase-like superfamily